MSTLTAPVAILMLIFLIIMRLFSTEMRLEEKLRFSYTSVMCTEHYPAWLLHLQLQQNKSTSLRYSTQHQ